jgi:hypothetical protein
MRRFFLIIFLLHFLLILGCGFGYPKLKGKVTFADGRPLRTGTVVFDNGVTTSRAQIQPDGTFIAGTMSERDGIPIGTYKVCIAGAVELLDNPDNQFPPPSRTLVHTKFTDAETSGLSITIDKSPEPYNIIVEPPE